MSDIKKVMDVCIEILNYRLTFEPYSFTISQFLLGLAALAAVIYFVSRLFDI